MDWPHIIYYNLQEEYTIHYGKLQIIINGFFLGDDSMSKLFKEILCYLGLVLLYILADFIMYKGNINLKNYIVDAIIF